MSHNHPFGLTNENPSLNNQRPSVPTLSTSLLPSVDLPPPQRRGAGPDRSFTKAALGRSRAAPYSRSHGTSATSHAEPTFPAWLAPRSAMRRSASERGSSRHRNTAGSSGPSNRTTGVPPMTADCAGEPSSFFRPTNQPSVLMDAAMVSPVEGSATLDVSQEHQRQSDPLSSRVQFSLKTPSPRKRNHPSSFITPENHNTPSPPRTPCPRKDITPPLTVRKIRAQLSYGLQYLSGKDLSSWQDAEDAPPAGIPPVNLTTPPGARRVDYDATDWKGDSGDEAEEEAEMLASVNKPRRA